MPLYEFRCDNCGLLYEEIITKDREYAKCPKCDDVKHSNDREISRGSFKLKGQCWSKNGYMKGEK